MSRAETNASAARDVGTTARVDDDDDDGFEILTTTTTTTTTRARAFERRRTRVRTFDDFTVAFVSNEARDSSLADGRPAAGRRRRRRDVDEERRRDAAFARAISDETRVGVDAGERALRPEMYERLVRTCLRRRGSWASARDANAARRAFAVLRARESRAPATTTATASATRADDGTGTTRRKSRGGVSVVDVTETPPIVVTTAEAWTPLENAERSGDGERD